MNGARCRKSIIRLYCALARQRNRRPSERPRATQESANAFQPPHTYLPFRPPQPKVPVVGKLWWLKAAKTICCASKTSYALSGWSEDFLPTRGQTIAQQKKLETHTITIENIQNTMCLFDCIHYILYAFVDV